MSVELLTEDHLEFLSLKAGCARLSLHLSKCHIVGNHISLLNLLGMQFFYPLLRGMGYLFGILMHFLF